MSDEQSPGVVDAPDSPTGILREGPLGLSTVEMGLAVIVLVSALVLTLQVVRQYKERAGANERAEEFIKMEEAFQSYYRKYQTAPPSEELPGRIPAGMEPYLLGTVWTDGSASGGKYVWLSPCPEAWAPKHDGTAGPPLGAIMLSSYAPEPALVFTLRQEELMRERLDQVPRLRGKFRAGFNGWPLLLVYPKS